MGRPYGAAAALEGALAGGDLHWSGRGGHQRLLVAVAEMLRLAATDRCAVLLVHDLHQADEVTLRLAHYLARCATTERVALLVAFRPTPINEAFEQFRASLTAGAAVVRALSALSAPEAEQLADATRRRPGRPCRHRLPGCRRQRSCATSSASRREVLAALGGELWQAGVPKARAHLADAENEPGVADGLRHQAAGVLLAPGQPLDAARYQSASNAKQTSDHRRPTHKGSP